MNYIVFDGTLNLTQSNLSICTVSSVLARFRASYRQ